MSSTPTKTTFIRRIAFVAAPLVVLLLVWPATRAHADIFSVFTDLFNTVTSTLGGPSSAIDSASSQQLQFLTNSIYPQSLIDQVHSSISTTSSTYRPWMASVMALPTNSATAASSRQLESATRGGSSVLPSQLKTSFQTTYGSPVTAKGAATFTQTVTDMSDSQALDVFSLTSASDFTADTLISQSHTMYSSALANQRLIRSGKLPHGLRFWYRHSGEDHCDECVQLRVTRITEDSSSYYVHVVAENKASHPYRLREAAVTALRPSFSENIPANYLNQQISVDALREMGSFAPESLRTHGSTLNAPRDLKAGERAEWIVGFAKPGRTPAVYQFSLPDDEQHPVTATVVF